MVNAGFITRVKDGLKRSLLVMHTFPEVALVIKETV